MSMIVNAIWTGPYCKKRNKEKQVLYIYVRCSIFYKGALTGPGLAGLLGSGGPATSSSTSRLIFWFLHAYF